MAGAFLSFSRNAEGGGAVDPVGAESYDGPFLASGGSAGACTTASRGGIRPAAGPESLGSALQQWPGPAEGE